MAVLDSISTRLSDLLAATPPIGERNRWLYAVARNARYYASPQKVRVVLERTAQRWNDRNFASEIERAVSRAYGTSHCTPSAPARRTPPWPPTDERIWLERASGRIAFPSDPLPISTTEVLDALFPGEPLLCLALDIKSAHTQPRSHWRNIETALQFIVANPMSAVTGLTQDGRKSPRCLANACKRKLFQVVEFDRGTLPQQAAVLTSLHSEVTPLVLVVWSGGKSLHGWYDVRMLEDHALLDFFRFAVALGADASLWDPCKLVRLPGGLRSGRKLQPILHFSPRHV